MGESTFLHVGEPKSTEKPHRNGWIWGGVSWGCAVLFFCLWEKRRGEREGQVGHGRGPVIFTTYVAPQAMAPQVEVWRPGLRRYLNVLGPTLPRWQMCGSPGCGVASSGVAPLRREPQKGLVFELFWKKGYFWLKFAQRVNFVKFHSQDSQEGKRVQIKSQKPTSKR